MNDRELLELAAKAAQLDFVPSYDGGLGFIGGVVHKPWNPLTDDGDALRLAAKLKIDIEWQATQVGAEPAVEAYRYELDGGCFCASEHENDCRRAIVRAAAEIGRRMP